MYATSWAMPGFGIASDRGKASTQTDAGAMATSAATAPSRKKTASSRPGLWPTNICLRGSPSRLSSTTSRSAR